MITSKHLKVKTEGTCIMNNKELLKTIKNDIENIDNCIEMCNDYETFNYLLSIKENLRKEEIKLVKQMYIKKP